MSMDSRYADYLRSQGKDPEQVLMGQEGQLVLACLEHGAKSEPRIAKDTKIKKRDLERTLTWLADRNKILQRSDDLWVKV